MCVDNPDGQTANGTPIQLYSCDGGSSGNWIITNRANGGVEIKNKYSGKCLFNQWAGGADDGKPIVISDCNANDYGRSGC